MPYHAPDTCVAVLGYGCRLPGGVVDGPSFWRLLIEGRDAVTEIPPDRWDPRVHASARPGTPGKSVSRWGGFLDSIDRFEPLCFGISPREAEFMDPQQRLLLEATWEALEMSGIPISSLGGSKTGVFIGIATGDYAQAQRGAVHGLRGLGPFTAHGSAQSISANRISYWLDARGPSFIIDTACSSALVALDRAVKSLSSGESDVAVVGGVNLLLGPEPFVSFSQASMLSPNGRCRAFDAAGDGFVRAEGVGVVVLKRLVDAEREQDPIQAVVLGTGVNQDGRTAGLSMPNPASQADLLRDVYSRVDLSPNQVRYVEAHGTGTAVGDPAEAKALAEVLASNRRSEPLILGSVKTNIGHMEAGSGMAGLIKSILMLQHRTIPPSLHFETPNPNIPFAEWRLRVPTTAEPWPSDEPGVIGVNSFGFGGTNAHAVVGEAPEGAARRPARSESGSSWPVVITARSRDALKELAASWVELSERAENCEEIALADASFTSAVRRSTLDFRFGTSASSWAQLRDRVQRFVDDGDDTPVKPKSFSVHAARAPHRRPTVAFVFSGQGPERPRMGAELWEREPIFRAALERCDVAMRGELGWSVAELLLDERPDGLSSTAVAQPALFALQVALAEQWCHWGVVPSAVVGHSVGEIAAAYVSGKLTLDSAARLVVRRGRAMEDHAVPGRMVAVGASPSEVTDLLDGVEIAAVNAPRLVTLAGPIDAVERLEERLATSALWWRGLGVRHGFHTECLDPARTPFLESAGELDPGDPKCTMISSVTGEELPSAVEVAYWWKNIREPVRFRDAIDHLGNRGVDLVIEIGPHPVLSASVGATLTQVPVVSSLHRDSGEHDHMLASLSGAYVHGVDVSWDAVWPNRGRCVALPRHPWSRGRFWREAPDSRKERLPAAPHPLLGVELHGPTPGWRGSLDGTSHRWLADHTVGGRAVFPAAGMVEMATAAACRFLGTEECTLDSLVIRRGIVVDPDRLTPLSVSVEPSSESVRLSVGTDGAEPEWSVVCDARVRPLSTVAPRDRLDVSDLVGSVFGADVGVEPICVADLYRRFEDAGLGYGSVFRTVQGGYYSGRTAVAHVSLPDDLDIEGFGVHPALLDGCFHAVQLVLAGSPAASAALFLPQRFGCVRLHRKLGRSAWGVARLTEATDLVVTADVMIFDDRGRVALDIQDFECRATSLSTVRQKDSTLYRVEWTPDFSAALAVEEASSVAADSGPVASRAEAEAVGVWVDREIGSAEANLDFLNQWARVLVRDALQAEVEGPDDVIDLDEWIAEGRLAAHFREMFVWLLEDLQRDGLVEPVGDRVWRLAASIVAPTSTVMAETLREEPESYAELRLIELVAMHLPGLWRGEEQIADILSSAEGRDLLNAIHGDSPWARYANRWIAGAVLEIVDEVEPDRPVRILEIGGGTGATASEVLPSLAERQVVYWFTDASDSLLSSAKARFRASKRVQYEQVDIDVPFDRQGIRNGTFDVVIAADALYASKDVKRVLRRIASALRPGGHLLVHERTRRDTAREVAVGFSEEWRSFHHDPFRSAPLLSRRGWIEMIEESGFDSVAHPTGASEIDFATVILARRGREGAGQHAVEGDSEEPRIEGGSTTPDPAATVPERDGSATSSWIVVTDGSLLAAQATEALGRSGAPITAVSVSKASAQELEKAKHVVQGDDVGVLFFSGRHPPDAIGVSSACEALLCAVRAAGALPVRRFVVVTRGGHTVGDRDRHGEVTSAGVVGFTRVVASEFPHLDVQVIDVDPNASGAEEILAELRRDVPVEEAAWRNGIRWLPSLRARGKSIHRGTPPFQLVSTRTGDLDGVVARARDISPPADGEVCVEVRFTALNFRDVLKVLGTYPARWSHELLLGDECAGYVREVGPGVEGLEVGDRVVLVGPGVLASEVTVRAEHLFAIPGDLSMAAAAGLSVAGLTARYALHEVARIRSTDTILIHSAAGGVGQVALQLARHAGARIIATAGSPAKRALVAAMGADVVLNSRSLDFLDEIREHTAGRGVDVVLNSLSGRAMRSSLAALADEGRFIELGKRDFVQNSTIGLALLERGISYHAIDPRRFDPTDENQRAVIQSVLSDYAEGIFALPTRRIYPAARTTEALRSMAAGFHVGKLVIDMARPGPVEVAPSVMQLRTDRSYLITGGFGGTGLALAEHLLSRGARHLVLVGRSGATDESTRQRIDALRETGATVVERRCDVAELPAVTELVQEIRRAMPPLAGVFHLAMVLDDATVADLDLARLDGVIQPKVGGAWNLHHVTADDPVDLFVMFGSISAVLGNYGQANYAAANAALEALASHRRALALPATTVALGMLGEVGRVAQSPELQRTLERAGLEAMSPEDLWASIDEAVTAPDPVTVAVRADWHAVSKAIGRGTRLPGLTHELTEIASDPTRSGTASVLDLLRESALSDRLAVTIDFIRASVAKVLGGSAEAVEPDRPLASMGLDSLLGMELMMELESAFGAGLPASALAAEVTIEDLAVRLLDEVFKDDGSETGISGPPTSERSARVVEVGGAQGSPAIVVVPAPGGDLGIYNPLIDALANSLRVFAIDFEIPAGDRVGGADHDAAVDSCAAAIQVHEKLTGRPIHLIGFSAGGVMAHEVARVLEAEGIRVAMVGLIETDVRGVPASDRAPRLTRFLGQLIGALDSNHDFFVAGAGERFIAEGTPLAEALLLDPGNLASAIDWFRERDYFAVDVPPAGIDILVARLARHVDIVGLDEPLAPIRAPIVSWRAEHGVVPVVEGEQSDRVLSTDHFGIMEGPHVEEIARSVTALVRSSPPVVDPAVPTIRTRVSRTPS